MTSATMSEFGTGNLLKISFKLVSTDDKLTSLIGFKTPNSTPSDENKVSLHEGYIVCACKTFLTDQGSQKIDLHLCFKTLYVRCLLSPINDTNFFKHIKNIFGTLKSEILLE